MSRQTIRWGIFLVLTVFVVSQLSNVSAQPPGVTPRVVIVEPDVVIDFETDGFQITPLDDQQISIPFTANNTFINFGFDLNDDLIIDTPALFERYGEDGTDSFIVSRCGEEEVESLWDVDCTPDGQGGDFFLRNPENVSLLAGHDLIIEYTGALPNSLSGQIWDVDFRGEDLSDAYLIEALDTDGNLLREVSISKFDLPSSLDGLPFSFSLVTTNPIRRVRISSKNVGALGFDNFTPVRNLSRFNQISQIYLESLGCERQGTVRSGGSDIKSAITINNQSDEPVKMIPINESGFRGLPIVLEPGRARIKPGFETDVWLVTSMDNRCLALVELTKFSGFLYLL